MTWFNHKVCTFSVVFLLTRDIIVSILSAMASIIPDLIEGFRYDERWQQNHRRLSHWFILYLLMLVLGLVILSRYGINPFIHISIDVFKVISYTDTLQVAIIGYFWLIIGLGGLMHILQDSLSAPVPLLHPNKRVFRLANIRVNSFTEYAICFGMFLLAVLVMWGRGGGL